MHEGKAARSSSDGRQKQNSKQGNSNMRESTTNGQFLEINRLSDLIFFRKIKHTDMKTSCGTLSCLVCLKHDFLMLIFILRNQVVDPICELLLYTNKKISASAHDSTGSTALHDNPAAPTNLYFLACTIS